MITNGQQTYASNNTNAQNHFINLSGFTGSGEVGRYLDDHTGILLGIQPRGGTYKVTDRRTGVVIERPNSWTAIFADGMMVSWPTYVDQQTGQVMPWSRFDPSINLAECVEKHIPIHLWKDDKKFFHLELATETMTGNLNPLPIMPAPAPAPAPAPMMMMNPANMPTQEPWRTGQVYQQ